MVWWEKECRVVEGNEMKWSGVEWSGVEWREMEKS